MTPDDDLVRAAAAEAADADAGDAFHIDVEGFEGPLHLLLDLARRQKVDLAQISILDLAEQYLAFVEDARARRIDLAADYLLMAAWLAYLKSRLLLPREGDEAEGGGEEMADRLAFRLARLEAMRRASRDLMDGHLDGRDVFARGMPEALRIVATPRWTTSLYDLMKAFGDIHSRRHRQRRHVIRRQPVLPIDTARRQLKTILPELTEWRSVQSFRTEDPSEAPQRSVTASIFSAALELARDRALELRQDAPFAEVYLRRAATDQADGGDA
jgi:segregation and condensation protein A